MSTLQNPDYLLVDGSAVLFRSYHAMPPLETSQGQPTGAVKGFINAINLLGKRFPESLVVVVFDSPGPSFRKDIYPLYKANRSETPEDLVSQIAPIHEFIERSGYPLVRLAGFEADDIIAAYCRQAGAQQSSMYIVSNDKDLAQLVNDQVMMYDLSKDKVTDREGVHQRHGVWPEQILDYLTLTGDNSDNIPGVPSVGPKTAAKWLHQYQTLDTLLIHSKDIKGKVGEQLRNACEEIIPLARRLVTLDSHCPVEPALNQLSQQPADRESLTRLGTELEMSIPGISRDKPKVAGAEETIDSPTILNSSTTHKPTTAEDSTNRDGFSYELINEAQQLKEWIKHIEKNRYFAFDTETNGLNSMTCQLVGLSLALPDTRCCYLPLAHKDDSTQLTLTEVLEELSTVFSNPDITMVGQNIKFDLHVLASYGMYPTCQLGDTMLQSYCLDSSRRHDMDSLAQRELSWKAIAFEEVVGKGKNQKTFDQIPVPLAAPYAAEDAWLTMRLNQTFTKKLQKPGQSGPADVYQSIEVPLIPVLQDMERNGALIDSKMLHRQSQQIGIQLTTLTAECHERAGMVFNLNSPKQLQTVLFEHLKIPGTKKTSTGQSSTSEEVLQELALEYPLAERLLTYRSLKKLQSTYTDRLPEKINPDTGRVHSSFQQTVASTGRLSSSHPNLQNIPIRTEEGRNIRKAFISEPGNVLISADYSQIELRIMAHLSQDQGLLHAFSCGEDIHSATAAEIFGVALDQVTSEHRRNAKAINFGLIYGMSAFGLARQLGIARHQAKDYMETYFNRYPGVLKYMESTRELARTQGFVETLCGRRLYFSAMSGNSPMRKQAAERAAINAPMQGTAADIIKKAMINLYQMWHNHSEIRMILQVHDELVFEVPENFAEECRGQISEVMSQAMELSVPLIVEAGIGNNWLQAH